MAGIRCLGWTQPRGDHLVRLRQHIATVEVYGQREQVVIAPRPALVALTGSPVMRGRAEACRRRFLLTPGQALSRALQDLYGVAVPDGVVAPAVSSQPFSWLSLPAGTSVRLAIRRGPRRSTSDRRRPRGRVLPGVLSAMGPARRPTPYRYLIAADDRSGARAAEPHRRRRLHYRCSPRARRPPSARWPIADFTPASDRHPRRH